VTHLYRTNCKLIGELEEAAAEGAATRKREREEQSEISRMLATGTITARISCRVGLEGAGELLETPRKGQVRGKAVLRL
jgi:hypothetical protein